MRKRVLAWILVLTLLFLSALPGMADTIEGGTSDFVIDDKGVLTDYTGAGGDVVIPAEVKAIGPFAFENCMSLTGVVIPEGVYSIGQGAFYCCENLQGVVIPGTVSVIGEDAFHYCRSLTDVTIPSRVKRWGAFAFSDCINLTQLTIEDGVPNIGKGVFCGCKRIRTLTLPESIVGIGEDAFYACRSLTSITIPRATGHIGEWAFLECDALRSITVLNKRTILGEEAVPVQTRMRCYKGSAADLWAQQNGNRIEYLDGELSVSKLKASLSGNTITWTTDVSNASGRMYYQYNLYQDGKGLLLSAEESTSGKFKYKASESGEYCVEVIVRDSASMASKTSDPVSVALKPTAITLNRSGTVDLDLGYALKLKYALKPETAVSDVKWKSSDKKIATVDENGTVTPLKAGTVTITATTIRGGKSAKVKVKVVDPFMPTGIQLDAESPMVLSLGETLSIECTMQPFTAVSEIKWKSSNKKIAQVDENGTVTPLKAGTVTIAASTVRGGKSAKVKVKVIDPTMLTGIRLDAESPTTLTLGETLSIGYTLKPETAVSDVKWKSSDKKIARVDKNGTVTPLKAGTVTITATTARGGKKAKVKIKIIKPVAPKTVEE